MNTQNIYNNYVAFRQTGDFIRSKLSLEKKIEILNTIDKIGALVDLHFEYDEVKNNILLKNTSPYKSCQIYNGKSFVVASNQELFRFYIMDFLDTLDYFAVEDIGDKDLIRRGFEKGCDEWITKIDDSQGMIRLLGHHLDF